MMKQILAFALIVAGIYVAQPTPAQAGPCQHSYDRASDGSRCGGRAADRRSGGN
ncbi:hypothetical protein [Microvirga sp. TS319]|uniref:hypothetical protein n=1 Tax=Microvirga sp. TS319 TaxID=3241165 RepID=UPI00351A5015